MSVKITCINKDGGYHQNPHEAISHLGWIEEATNSSGKSTRLEMVDWIENKSGVAYTKDELGNVAYLIVKTSTSGNKYVQTIADSKETNNLLSLPECA
jgi:hypothetical protein